MRTLAIVATLIAVAAAASAQTRPARLTVIITNGSPRAFSETEFRSMPRTTVALEEDGRPVTYEGVLVADVLTRAGASMGAALRGEALASYVVATASDGYRVVFSLGELDPSLARSRVLVADTVDGKPLFAYQGPFRLVVPGDTRGARSVRMLQQLEVIRIPAREPSGPDAVAELGRHLFYDTRLSANGTQSCATCHQQALAFTDGKAHAVGSTGERHPHSSMSLMNVGAATQLNWTMPLVTSLEAQAEGPMFGTNPIELGLSRDNRWLAPLNADATYARLLAAAHPDRPALTRQMVIDALAGFQRTLVSTRSPWDRYHFERDDTAISDAAKRGEVLFHSRPLSCFTCHGGVYFSNAMGPRNRMSEMTTPAADKAPTLRNIAVTAPYMRDGSLPTLEAVIDAYAAGRTTLTPPTRPFSITIGQRADLIAFLESLTDAQALVDTRWTNPWGRHEHP